MIPTVGRIVHYSLDALDVERILKDRAERDLVRGSANLPPKYWGNQPYLGQAYPAVIVVAWGKDETSMANLQVLLDGEDTLWVTSKGQHLDPSTEPDAGHWIAPPRA